MMAMMEEGADTAVVVSRKIEFHVARKQFNGFSSGSSNGFKLVTLNPNASNLHKADNKNTERLEIKENLLDQELSFRLTVRRIGAGLRNLGNTCFLNSVLQCLTYTEPLAAYLQSGKHESSCRTAGFCALCAIQKHVSRALQSTGRILEPKDLVSNLRCISRNFRNARQEDAHEYMVNLLESMHKCCLPSGVPSESPSAYEKSLVHKIFGGRLRSQVKCMQCSYSSNKFDPFLDLSLEINRADSLHKALNHFTAKEQLDGGAKQYQCQQCKQKVRALKQLTVYKPPNVLAIHLKRFGSHVPGQKINKDVSFSPNLDMKPFVSGPYDGDLKYTLYGVLVHAGWSTHSGHYYCFVRTSTGMWYSLDDNQVYQVSEKKVLGQKAYMLFYVRDRGNPSAKKPVDFHNKENSVANAAHKKMTPELRVTNQNGIVEKRVEGSSASLSKKDLLTTSTPKENPSEKIPLENVKGGVPKRDQAAHLSELPSVVPTAENLTECPKVTANAVSHQADPISTTNPQSEPSSVVPTAENLVGCPSTTVRSVSHQADPSSTTNPQSEPSSVVPSTENLVGCPSTTVRSVSHQAEPSSTTEASGDALSSGDHTNDADCNNKLDSTPDVNTDNVNKGQIVSALGSRHSCEPCTVPGEVCTTGVSHSGQFDGKTIPEGTTEEVSNTTDCPKSSKKRSIEECQVGLVSSADSTNPPPTPDQTSCVTTRKKQAKLKMKRKLVMHQVPGLRLSSNILSGGGLQKKRKRSKCLPAQTKSDDQKLGNGTADCGGSSASSKSSNVQVDNCMQSHIRKAGCDSNGKEKTSKISIPSSNGVISGDIISTEQRKRLKTDTTVVMSEKPQKVRKSAAQGPDNSQNQGTELRQSNIMSILTRGLDETTVARWDGTEVSHAKDKRVEREQLIGYVGDEWDEEYDKGKRKKIKEYKMSYDGPNLFQEVAARKKNDRQPLVTKKKMTDRRKFAAVRRHTKGKHAYRK